jgi:23S rRNA pseudouridine1911/1915/1917 synthase
MPGPPAILLETPQLLVVHKPAGMAVERQLHGYPSVEDWAWQYLSAASKKPFVGIVHRLDRPVSGVLLLAKKRAALKDLNLQFAERRTEKIYRAIVQQAPQNAAGTLVHWLARNAEGKQAIVVAEGAVGAARCELKYSVLEELAQGFLLEIKPIQGRFHQIRAQLAAAGMPIIGDAKYGSTIPYLPEAIALHAHSLRFRDPADGQWRTVTAEWEAI